MDMEEYKWTGQTGTGLRWFSIKKTDEDVIAVSAEAEGRGSNNDAV